MLSCSGDQNPGRIDNPQGLEVILEDCSILKAKLEDDVCPSVAMGQRLDRFKEIRRVEGLSKALHFYGKVCMTHVTRAGLIEVEWRASLNECLYGINQIYERQVASA